MYPTWLSIHPSSASPAYTVIFSSVASHGLPTARAFLCHNKRLWQQRKGSCSSERLWQLPAVEKGSPTTCPMPEPFPASRSEAPQCRYSLIFIASCSYAYPTYIHTFTGTPYCNMSILLKWCIMKRGFFSFHLKLFRILNVI